MNGGLGDGDGEDAGSRDERVQGGSVRRLRRWPDQASRRGGAMQNSARAPANGQGGGRRAAQAGRRSMRILAERQAHGEGEGLEREHERENKGKRGGEKRDDGLTACTDEARRRSGSIGRLSWR